ncbi:MAG: M23 family metallopeptidase [Actinomycetota bacterium]
MRVPSVGPSHSRRRVIRLCTFAVAWTTIATLSTAVDSAEASPTGSQAEGDALLEVCPIAGDHEWVDSWGWPRSGGRTPPGIDVSASRCTEIYSVRDGAIDVKQTNLGGNSIWLVTDDGDRFFYAHLDAFEGDDRRVEAGDLIGYVGSTGNAGGPHLHFETHPDGTVMNPFEAVVRTCTVAAEAAGDRVEPRLPDERVGALNPDLGRVVPR